MKIIHPKALVLFSGGLDSMLAVKILREQKIKVAGLTFQSYFFGPDKAKEAAKQLGIPLRVIDFSKEHLQIVKKPHYGFGKAANPCIDCHLLMLKRACQLAKKEDFDFVATGEVLGERPFSQNKNAMALIAKESGLGDKLLRPLSARLLPTTLPEKNGWVKREELLAIQGRSRRTQISLAKKFGLEYPQPAGGCILTEKDFGQKLFELFEKLPTASGDDIALLFLGRHFWVGKTKIVLGKNQEENEKLEKMARKNDALTIPKNFPGPTALLRGSKIGQKAIKKAQKLIIRYSKRLPHKPEFQV
jgi:tRNA-specific 2-thiouridylase